VKQSEVMYTFTWNYLITSCLN